MRRQAEAMRWCTCACGAAPVLRSCTSQMSTFTRSIGHWYNDTAAARLVLLHALVVAADVRTNHEQTWQQQKLLLLLPPSSSPFPPTQTQRYPPGPRQNAARWTRPPPGIRTPDDVPPCSLFRHGICKVVCSSPARKYMKPAGKKRWWDGSTEARSTWQQMRANS